MVLERPASIIDLITKDLGINVEFDESDPNRELGTASEIVFQQNPRRIMFLLVNLGSANIFLAPRANVGTDKGVFISPNGGSLISNWKEDLVLPALEWHGVASAANADIFTLEVSMR